MTLRMRVLPRFPATIYATNGLIAERTENGPNITIKPDFGSLVQIPDVEFPDEVYFMAWDKLLGLYRIMSFSDLFAGVSSLGFMSVEVYDPQGKNADAFDRENHTGLQAISTITNLQESLDNKADGSALNAKLNLSGGTLTGLLALAASTTSLSPARIPNGATPSAPTDGDIWRNDATGGIMFRKSATTRQVIDEQNISSRVAVALLQDQKASGTGGGSSVSGWQTRTLNTEVYDSDNIVTLSSNLFTPTYDCEIEFETQGYGTNNMQSRIYNVTDGVVAYQGLNAWASPSPNNYSTVSSRGKGKVTAGKTYRLEMYANIALATTGLGVAANSGSSEIYSSVHLRRL